MIHQKQPTVLVSKVYSGISDWLARGKSADDSKTYTARHPRYPEHQRTSVLDNNLR